MDDINPHDHDNSDDSPNVEEDANTEFNDIDFDDEEFVDVDFDEDDLESEGTEADFEEDSNVEDIGAEDAPDEPERLQKLISRAGIASRRAAEDLIAAGKVSINGHVVREPGIKADLTRDLVIVNGHPLRKVEGPSTVILLHKPRGVMTTKSDPEGRPTVFDTLPRKYRTFHTVGRLDYDTAGLLLLTDDGTLTQLLTHPSHGVTKTYHARVRGTVTIATLKKLEKGIRLEDGMTAPCRARVKVQTAQNALVEITLHEGRNRQVRRMLEAVGHPVASLRRVRFAQLDLVGVTVGQHRVLLPGEVHQLRKQAETKKSDSRPGTAPPRKAPSRRVTPGKQKKSTSSAATARPSKNAKAPAASENVQLSAADKKSTRPARAVTVAKPLRNLKKREGQGTIGAKTDERRGSNVDNRRPVRDKTETPKTSRSEPSTSGTTARAQKRPGSDSRRDSETRSSATERPRREKPAGNKRADASQRSSRTPRSDAPQRDKNEAPGALARRIAREWKD